MQTWNREASEWYDANHAERPTARLVVEQLAIEPGSTVLDLGCGPAYALRVLAMRDAQLRLVGVDPVPVAIELAKNRIDLLGAPTQIELRVGSATELPLDAGAVDLALAIDCFDYWADAAGGLRELRRVLRRDGRLALAKDLGDANAAASSAALRQALTASRFECLREETLEADGVALRLWETRPQI